MFRSTDTAGGKYDILTLPDTQGSADPQPGAQGQVNYGRRYCENVILSTKEFTPFAYNASGAFDRTGAQEIARDNGAADRIMMRTQIGPGKYRS